MHACVAAPPGRPEWTQGAEVNVSSERKVRMLVEPAGLLRNSADPAGIQNFRLPAPFAELSDLAP